ncbi:MAG TPA: acyl carrier protein [Fibrobacteres bacterium]|jgi:acyl carrier protein|nr:acyl carrier protein [Fibrobacterota bacterium]
MDRETIYGVVKKYILENIEDVKETDLDPEKSMKDLGANSLDIIEVVSCSMRELNIKIPRSELADIKTIDGLVDKFVANINS